MKVLTITAPKGGTGKTATAGAIAEAAALDGQRVLIVDMDPQADLTLWFGGDPRHAGSYDIITGRATAAEAVQTINTVDLIPANADLTALTTSPGSAQRLNNALKSINRKYNLCVIDTAPAMNEALNNVLFASDRVLIPLEAEASSLQALYAIIEIISQVKQSKPKLKIAGVVVTRYDGRPKINRLYYDGIANVCKSRGIDFLGSIRAGVAIREAMAVHDPLFEYAPYSKPAEDYRTLYEKIKGAL